jgi:hypothetical protein
MKTERIRIATIKLCLAISVGWSAGAVLPVVAEVDLITTQTPWRVWMATGPSAVKADDGQTMVGAGNKMVPLTAQSVNLGQLPPDTWNRSDYDDRLWGRYGADVYEYAGGYGWTVWGPHGPVVLYLRTRLGVTDPSKAKDVTVTVEYLGGVVVYVNGREVGRGNLPEGKIEPHTLAADYPVESYTTESGDPLPLLGSGQPDAKWATRYQTRVRTLKVTIPADALIAGGNALALEFHRARIAGPMPRSDHRTWWSHVLVRDVRLTSAMGAGVTPYADAIKGTRVWSAQPVDQVTDVVSTKRMIQYGWACLGTRGMPLKGITIGNPFDPVVPVRFLVPRNGVGSGQVVLSDPDGLKGVSAAFGKLQGPGGNSIPAEGVRIWFGTQRPEMHWCDGLADKAPEGARTVPVWVEVRTAKDSTPGWYGTTLSLEANAKKFQVPVQVFVTGFRAPDSRNFRSFITSIHSPEALAKAYGVKAWSDEHLKLMDRSLEMIGQMGNDVMIVPVIVGGHMGHETGLIRWVKQGDQLKPDFSLFEKYMDLYLKYCAAPAVISLYVWSADTVKEIADGYENRRIPTRESKPKRPLLVTQWDPVTGVTTNIPAPTFLDDGAEAFWKPMLDGVHDIVVKRRGWSERVIMLGIGSDIRPSQKTGEVLRQWAPYARWHLYSHFSAEGMGKDGKLTAVGGLEIGFKECPSNCNGPTELTWERGVVDYERSTIHRGACADTSGPMVFRTLPAVDRPALGRWSRVGVDFWPGIVGYGAPIWGTCPIQLAWRGPEGPLPTVRMQLLREALQDFEARMVIVDAMAKMPREQQALHQQLLDGYFQRLHVGAQHLSQVELGLDWSSYFAKLHQCAAELQGENIGATWDVPPK